ncbi:MAG TPA: hypothetical protein PKH93_00935 [Chitinophagales bacterium]|nr:hypothetical protein [Chitinophagales bacterium]
MKKTTITNITTLCVVLVGGLVANCSCSNNGATISPTTSPPPDSIAVQKPKFAHLGRIPFEQWKDETKYVLSMLDDTVGLSTNNQFMLVKKNSMQQGELIKVYAQMYKGVEVLGGGGNLIFEQDTLYDKTEHFYKISLDVTPSISEAQALAAIQADETQALINKTPIAKKGLLIMPMYGRDANDMRLCWFFVFEGYDAYIDAHKGEVVLCVPNVRT